MRVLGRSVCLASILLLATVTARAHRPYEHRAGTFKRDDGQIITIVRHRVDGIIAADPVSIQFRLPDGTEIAHTPHVFDAVVRRTPLLVEVYQFRTTFFPVASRVDVFDGYSLKDITSRRRAESPLVHFSGHWVGYLLVCAIGGALWAFSIGLRAIPNRGWRTVPRFLGQALVVLLSVLFAYDVMVFEPVSPLIILLCVVTIAAGYRWVHKGARNARTG